MREELPLRLPQKPRPESLTGVARGLPSRRGGVSGSRRLFVRHELGVLAEIARREEIQS